MQTIARRSYLHPEEAEDFKRIVAALLAANWLDGEYTTFYSLLSDAEDFLRRQSEYIEFGPKKEGV